MINYIPLWIYPIFVVLELIIACLVPYFKSTSDGDVEKDFPLISDTGDKGVAASAFSLLFNFYAFLIFIVIVCRFEQVKKTYNYQDHRRFFIANTVSTVFGFIGCFGIALLSSFQISTLQGVHGAGAVLAFGCGVIYYGINSVCSFLWKELPGSHIITNIIRLVLSVLHLAFLVGKVGAVIIVHGLQDPTYRRQAAILEWILAILTAGYLLTYIPEFPIEEMIKQDRFQTNVPVEMFYYIKPWMYPILLGFEVLIACLTPYLKASSDGTVVKDFPLISDTGDVNTGVAASAFSLLFNIYGLLVLVTIGIRFEQVRITYTYKEHKCSYVLNLVTVIAGLITVLSIFITATFQTGNNETMHNLGAVTAFSVGVGYVCVQTFSSFFWRKLPGSHLIINLIRLIMSMLSLGFLLGTFILIVKYRWNGDDADKRNAAILEWCLTLTLSSFFLTFIPEFYQYNWTIVLTANKIKGNKVHISKSASDKEYEA